MSESVLFIAGNQLFKRDHLPPPQNLVLVMVEDLRICTRFHYHQQKLGLILAAMREYAQSLCDAGYTLRYFDLDADTTIGAALAQVIEEATPRRLQHFEFSDVSLQRVIEGVAKTFELEVCSLPSPSFLGTYADFLEWTGSKRQLQMGRFYQHQRKRFGMLMDGDSPEGGRWSFDEDNRKKLPKKQAVPELQRPQHSDMTRKTLVEVARRFSQHPGDAADLWMPTTHSEAARWLEEFIKHRLFGFGTYEDAISQRSATLYHSTLSPLLNLGLLTPAQVLDASFAHREKTEVPLNDIEGFVRQVIGWREFVRGVYERHGDEMRASNKRGHTRELTQHWHDGTTGIPPLDDAIGHQLRYGWTHHINRLMIIANLMNLCMVRPQCVYDYFMQYYIDAYDWVMVPNVFGMGITSDAGVFATKPYVCGSNYILKMSDFARGDWCDVVDGLYWRFVRRNRDEFAANPRMGFTLKNLERMPADRAQRIFAAADAFLERCTSN